MSTHTAHVTWKNTTEDHSYDTYDRTHQIQFEGGSTLAASAAAEFLGKKTLANPEELLAAALSSCHMLTFLAIAAKSRFLVKEYSDTAVATLATNKEGRQAISHVILKPRVVFGGTPPTDDKILHMHEKSHQHCFIANSVACEVRVEAKIS